MLVTYFMTGIPIQHPYFSEGKVFLDSRVLKLLLQHLPCFSSYALHRHIAKRVPLIWNEGRASSVHFGLSDFET